MVLNSLGQSNTVVGPVKDAVVHSDEDISQDPEVRRGVLETTDTCFFIVLHLSKRRQRGKMWVSAFRQVVLEGHGHASAVPHRNGRGQSDESHWRK